MTPRAPDAAMALLRIRNREYVAIDENGQRRRFDDRANAAPVG